jgi:hypothetical protein
MHFQRVTVDQILIIIMSKSYVQVLRNVSNLLAGYPTEEELFGSTQKFVLFLSSSDKFQKHLYEYLVKKAESDILPYRMLVPSKFNGENITFVFKNERSCLSNTTAEELADEIYLAKVIFKNPITVKVLCEHEVFMCPNEFENTCSDCLGLMNCLGPDSARPCFAEKVDIHWSREAETPTLRSKFFEFMFQKLKFETIYPNSTKWMVCSQVQSTIIDFYDEFNRDVTDFARKVCDYIAPRVSYENNDIRKLNQTYIRFQNTNAFRFVKKKDVKPTADYLYIPDNLEEVLQQINSSTAGIYDDWQRILDIKQNIDELKHIRSIKALHTIMKGRENQWHLVS